MNYNHCNKIYDFFRKKLSPHFVHNFSVVSFDEYLRQFAYLPSGKWLRDMDKVKLTRITFGIQADWLAKKIKDNCITYNSPAKLDEGIQRVIYQYSPTLHFESSYWLWMEHEEVQSYASVIVCYNDEFEFNKFLDIIWKNRMEGNTADKPQPAGFNLSTLGFAT